MTMYTTLFRSLYRGIYVDNFFVGERSSPHIPLLTFGSLLKGSKQSGIHGHVCLYIRLCSDPFVKESCDTFFVGERSSPISPSLRLGPY
jgi:hypothetical protein